MRLNAKQIADYTGGSFVVEPTDSSALATDVTWDSREVRPGGLYVALPGARVDGHDFVGDALRAGAVCALVMQPVEEPVRALARELGACIIEVSSTAAAITDLARAWRVALHGRVIAITGSTGKTTTKNFVRDVLAAQGSVVATRGNQNNELGVPKTILSADRETQFVVVEMGMRGIGQIDYLCDYVLPDWGLITNVGESHIELLGSRENIARAKFELLDALPAGIGTAFLNADDDMCEFMWNERSLSARGIRRVQFSSAPACACAQQTPGDGFDHPFVWAQDAHLDGEGRATFTICAKGFGEAWPPEQADAQVERQTCHLSLRGMHNVSNALAAAAIGRACGMSLADIARALEKSLPEAGRQTVLKARAGFTVVDDAYNANPDSMRAALSTFCALSVAGRRIAVLGDMGELGDFSQACHEGVGAYAASLPLDRLLCVGKLSRFIASGAIAAGMDKSRVSCVDSTAGALAELDMLVEPADAVLVKASHFMNLARVVDGLVG